MCADFKLYPHGYNLDIEEARPCQSMSSLLEPETPPSALRLPRWKTLDALIDKLDGVNHSQARATLAAYNASVDERTAFDPTVLDGKGTKGLPLPKSNWAQKIETGPFRVFPVTGGITFTYGGVKVDQTGAVQTATGEAIPGLFAAGELVGGVFYAGYPDGSGLTSGAVFGRRAGIGASAT